MNRGYVRLWRKSLDAGWIKNYKLWCFWTYCLMKATHKEYDAVVGLQIVHLMPGQFIFGRRKAATETGLTEREIRTVLDFLRKAGNLTIKTTNKFSIITIVNWTIYQSVEIKNDPLNDQPLTSKGPHTRTKEHKNKYTSNFLSFWQAFPRKVGKDAAWRAWKKRNGELPLIDALLVILEQQKQSSQWQDKKYIPHPATWLNQGRWQDEVVEPKGGGDGWL